MAVLKKENQPQISVLVPAKDCAFFLASKISQLYDYLNKNLTPSFEIIIIPNGPDDLALEQTLKVAKALTLSWSNIRCVHFSGLRGKAAALRAGFDEALGHHIAFIDADMPFDLDFFKQAYLEVEAGVDLVSANRRIEQSVFIVPVPLLPLVYKRHWAGLAFNRFIRLLFPIQTLDSQAGLKYMSRAFAEKIFKRQLCTGFLLDVEIFLIASITKIKHVELPVNLHLYSEKSTVRLAKELGRALVDLSLIWLRYKVGEYSDSKYDTDRTWADNNLLTSDDWGISPGVNDGILELARRGIVRRVSILATGEHLQYKLDELKRIKTLQLGLHFNLTHGRPLVSEVDDAYTLILYNRREGHLVYKSPWQLFLTTLFPFLNRKKIRSQIAMAFEKQLLHLKSLQLKVDYFDSHHHVHLLPAIISIVAPLASKHALHWGRLVLDPWVLASKKFPLVLLSVCAKRQFSKNGIKYLKCRYPKYSHFIFPCQFRKKLNGLKNYEIIAHPAKYPDLHTIHSPDLYNSQRVREYWTLLNISPQNKSRENGFTELF